MIRSGVRWLLTVVVLAVFIWFLRPRERKSGSTVDFDIDGLAPRRWGSSGPLASRFISILVKCALVLLAAIVAAVIGSKNSASFSWVEILEECGAAFGIGMAVLMLPITLRELALAGPGERMSTARSVVASLLSAVLALAVAGVAFLVYIALALTFDPPSDDA